MADKSKDEGGLREEPGEDVFNRNEEVRYDTPRRYEEDDASAPLHPDDDQG